MNTGSSGLDAVINETPADNPIVQSELAALLAEPQDPPTFPDHNVSEDSNTDDIDMDLEPGNELPGILNIGISPQIPDGGWLSSIQNSESEEPPEFKTMTFEDDLQLGNTVPESRKRKRDEYSSSARPPAPMPPFQKSQGKLQRNSFEDMFSMNIRAEVNSPFPSKFQSEEEPTSQFSPISATQRIEHPIKQPVPVKTVSVKDENEGFEQLEWSEYVNQRLVPQIDQDLRPLAIRLPLPKSDSFGGNAQVLRMLGKLLKMKEVDPASYMHLTQKVIRIMRGCADEAVRLPLLEKRIQALQLDLSALDAKAREKQQSLELAEEKKEQSKQKHMDRHQLIQKIKEKNTAMQDLISQGRSLKKRKADIEEKQALRSQKKDEIERKRQEVVAARLKQYRLDIKLTNIQFLYKSKDIVVYKILNNIILKFHFKNLKYDRMEFRYHSIDNSSTLFDFWMHFLLAPLNNFSKFESAIKTRDNLPFVMEILRTHIARARVLRDKEFKPLHEDANTKLLPLYPLPDVLKRTKAAELSTKHKGLGDVVFQLVISHSNRACQLVCGVSHPYPSVKPTILCENFFRVDKSKQEEVKKAISELSARPLFLKGIAAKVKEIIST